MTHSNPEVGRELLASDLEPRTVVVMVASWCPTDGITAWVTQVSSWHAMFYVGQLNARCILLRTPDERLTDDTGRQVHVFEYREV